MFHLQNSHVYTLTAQTQMMQLVESKTACLPHYNAMCMYFTKCVFLYNSSTAVYDVQCLDHPVCANKHNNNKAVSLFLP